MQSYIKARVYYQFASGESEVRFYVLEYGAEHVESILKRKAIAVAMALISYIKYCDLESKRLVTVAI